MRAQERGLVEIRVKIKDALPRLEAERKRRARPSWGPAVYGDFSGLHSKVETPPGDSPMGTCQSCKPWGPAEEETKAKDLEFQN